PTSPPTLSLHDALPISRSERTRAGTMPRKISPEGLPDLLRPGMSVFVQGASGEPTALLHTLAAAPEASRGVHYVGCFIPGVNRVDRKSTRLNSSHVKIS